MSRLAVGQAEAVDILTNKTLDVLDRYGEGRTGRRLRRAVSRARARHRQAQAFEARGFYHGLITGYAVAMKVLQGKVSGHRSQSLTAILGVEERQAGRSTV